MILLACAMIRDAYGDSRITGLTKVAHPAMHGLAVAGMGVQRGDFLGEVMGAGDAA
jgi:hypothetical protein